MSVVRIKITSILTPAALVAACLACGTQSGSELERLNRARAQIQVGIEKTWGRDLVREARAATAASVGSEQVRREHFVAPDGSRENDGGEDAPWDLAFLLAHPSPVRPGDVVWLREGEYDGPFTSELYGVRGQPIVLRAYPGERAVLNDCAGQDKSQAVLSINGEFAWFWGLEIVGCSDDRRTVNGGSHPADRAQSFAVDMHGSDIKVINSVIHDAAQGVGSWASAKRGEIYGNVIYYNGWDGPDRGHGHGIYVQNEVGTKLVRENIVFRQFGNGIHAYGEDGVVNTLHLIGNVSFLNGQLSSHGRLQRNILLGGQTVAKNPLVEQNYTYYPLNGPNGGSNNVGYSAGCEEGAVANNYFVGPTALDVVNCGSVKFSGNSFIGKVNGLKPEAANNFRTDSPSGLEVFIRPNEWDPDRATIVVYNWERRESVDVDLSKAGFKPGRRVRIRSVSDYFGETREVDFDAEQGPVSISMTDWGVAQPKGWPAPESALPTFGVFVAEALDEAAEAAVA